MKVRDYFGHTFKGLRCSDSQNTKILHKFHFKNLKSLLKLRDCKRLDNSIRCENQICSFSCERFVYFELALIITFPIQIYQHAKSRILLVKSQTRFDHKENFEGVIVGSADHAVFFVVITSKEGFKIDLVLLTICFAVYEDCNMRRKLILRMQLESRI